MSVGGLFGNKEGGSELKLAWGREQQAAFLIFVWSMIREAVIRSEAPWAKAVLAQAMNAQPQLNSAFEETETAAVRLSLFESKDVSLLAADQGVQAVMQVVNALLWAADQLQRVPLDGWSWERPSNVDDNGAISHALTDLHTKLPDCVKFVEEIAEGMAEFDFRTSSAVPAENIAERNQQAVYKGSSGYSILRSRILAHLTDNGKRDVSDMARNVDKDKIDGSDD